MRVRARLSLSHSSPMAKSCLRSGDPKQYFAGECTFTLREAAERAISSFVASESHPALNRRSAADA